MKRNKSLKLLFAAAVCTFIGTKAAEHVYNPDEHGLAEGFDIEGVTEIYNASCGEREDARLRNIIIPEPNSTPDYFQSEEPLLAYISPQLSEQEQKRARDVVERIPDHIRDIIYSQGGVLVFSKDSLTEAVPEYIQSHGTVPRDNPYLSGYVGLYDGSQRRMFVTFYSYDPYMVDDNGNAILISNALGEESTSHHEIGHYADHIIGLLGHQEHDAVIEFLEDEGFINHSDIRINYTQGAEFTEVFMKDLENLAERSYGALSPISYYLPEKYNGKGLGGRHSYLFAAKREVFAELWSEVQGQNDNISLGTYYPETFELLKELDASLREAHRVRDMQCTYEHDKAVVIDQSPSV